VVTTGGLCAFRGHTITLFDNKFSSGGIAGFALNDFLTAYANTIGSTVIIVLLMITGLMLATKFSPAAFLKMCLTLMIRTYQRAASLLVIWKARIKKRRTSAEKKTVTVRKKEAKIKIETPPPRPKPKKIVPRPMQEEFDFMKSGSDFRLPPITLLDEIDDYSVNVDNENLQMQSRMVEKKLTDFGVQGEVSAVQPGPVITTFEYKPAAGVKISKIVNLTDDLALALRAESIRIVAPIPGKAAIGIEIPNYEREPVNFREIAVSEEYQKSRSKLTLCLGKDIVGTPVTASLDKMPHLLIAGATGAGKSVGLNSMIASVLFKATPNDVKLIMIDPKRIELSSYNGIPHLITPVVTDMKKATNALFWAVREMERRYELLSENKARNISQYNSKVDKLEKDKSNEEQLEKLPFIVIIIDELADLMMVSSRDVEVALTRLAQMARAAGIHLILATQRPSVDVLTGIIKANFPTRISFQVSSKIDSRTILDTGGAENLLGAGDMLYLPPGTAKIQRIHGAYISEEELSRVVDFLKKQKTPDYDESVLSAPEKEDNAGGVEEHDEKYDEAVALVTETGQASISMVQRHLRIGYNRAARIIEVMEKEGVVGPSDGAKPREVLVRGYDDIG
jgi:S-DNA-T family DNA segregation ATPase FtsK/SpoIIIE